MRLMLVLGACIPILVSCGNYCNEGCRCGSLSSVVSVINFRKKPSVISMASRKGAVHFVGSPQVEGFLLLVVGCMR